MAPNRGQNKGPGGNRGQFKGTGGRWNRLKDVNVDPLDVYGLPSKGDNSLLDFKTQERYYTKIVERYLSFCSDAVDRDELLKHFASVTLNDEPKASARPKPPVPPKSAPTSSATTAPASTPSSTTDTSPPLPPLPQPSPAAITAPSKDLDIILGALRKLREGIVASHRADDFAAQAYLFCIRLAILVRQPASYHPAILHLLRSVHRRHPHLLTPLELAEVSGYLVLDAACRRGELAEAYALRARYGLRDAQVDGVLRAVSSGNWVLFGRVARCVDGHRKAIVGFAEEEVRVHTLKCFGRGYLGVEVGYLEWATGKAWGELTGKCGVGWELDGTRVVIRKIGKK